MAIRPFFLLCGLAVVYSPFGAPAAVHFLLVGDTLDQALWESVVADFSTMTTIVQQAAAALDHPLFTYTLLDSKATPATVLGVAGGLEVAQEDLIVFYFSGHGFRTIEQDPTSCWPQLFFTSTRSALPMDDLLALLRTKKARLLVLLADCCNEYLAEGMALQKTPGRQRFLSQNERKGYQQLFGKLHGEVIAVASVPGTVAYASQEGGWFTTELCFLISQATRLARTPSWDDLLLLTGRQFHGRQRPVWELSLTATDGHWTFD